MSSEENNRRRNNSWSTRSSNLGSRPGPISALIESIPKTHRYRAKEFKQRKSIIPTIQKAEPSSVSDEEETSGPGDEREPIRPDDFLDDKITKTFGQSSELGSKVLDLCNISSNLSRELESTHSAILEKHSSLISTIRELRDLSSMTHQVSAQVETEREALIRESNLQLDSLDNFHDQAARIEELKKRVDTGRENISFLGERAAVVRKRVEDWELRERDKQVRITKRLRIFWGCVTGIIIAVAVLYLLPFWIVLTTKNEYSISSRIDETPDIMTSPRNIGIIKFLPENKPRSPEERTSTNAQRILDEL